MFRGVSAPALDKDPAVILTWFNLTDPLHGRPPLAVPDPMVGLLALRHSENHPEGCPVQHEPRIPVFEFIERS